MVTTLEELKQAKHTRELSLPPFPNGVPLTVEVKSPSMISMMFEGKLSNPILKDALSLMGENPEKAVETASLEQQKSTFEFVKQVVRDCLIQPTYTDIEAYAGGLTDAQLIVAYNGIMGETTELSSFR